MELSKRDPAREPLQTVAGRLAIGDDATALIQELYLSGKEKEAEAAVPDEFCELMSLYGPEGHVRDRIEAFRESGVTMLNVIPVGPDPARLISTVKNWL
jgi:hypothetical protein